MGFFTIKDTNFNDRCHVHDDGRITDPYFNETGLHIYDNEVRNSRGETVGHFFGNEYRDSGYNTLSYRKGDTIRDRNGNVTGYIR